MKNESNDFWIKTLVLAGVFATMAAAGAAPAPSAHHKAQVAKAQPKVEEVVTLPADTPVNLTLVSPVSSEFSHAGDAFQLLLAEPITVNGKIVVQAGTPVTGTVTIAQPSGRLARHGRLGIALGSIKVGASELALIPIRGTGGDAKSDRHEMLHGIGNPLTTVKDNLTPGFKKTPPAAQQSHRPDDPQTVAADPPDALELPGDEANRVARIGVTTATRAATNAVNFMFMGGPFGLARRGAAIDLAPGTRFHAVLLAANHLASNH